MAHRGGRVGWLAAAGLALCLAGGAARAVAQPVRSGEYQVKAAYLFHFAQFVTWPSSAFAGSSAPLEICVLGEDPFGAALDAVMYGERVGGRLLAVRRGRSLEGLRGCHILFVGSSEDHQVGAVMAELAGSPTLTVGESRRFLAAGGVIRFKLDANRVRLEVNRAQVDRRPFKLSSKLLRVADLVTPPEGSGAR